MLATLTPALCCIILRAVTCVSAVGKGESPVEQKGASRAESHGLSLQREGQPVHWPEDRGYGATGLIPLSTGLGRSPDLPSVRERREPEL